MNFIVKACGQVGKFVMQHNTTILTMASIAGVGGTAYLSGKAAVSASKKLEELEYTSEKKPTMVQKAKCIAPDVAPAIGMGLTTVACIIGMHKMHIKNQAAVAAMANMYRTRYLDYSEQVGKELSKKKQERLKDQAAQERVNREYPDGVGENGLNVIRTRFGNVLFMDSFTGRFFYSSYEAVERAKIQLTSDLQSHIYVSLNDFFRLLEIPETDAGDRVGWNICDIADGNEGTTEIVIVTNRTCKTPTPEELPCTIVDYEVFPLVDYDKAF